MKKTTLLLAVLFVSLSFHVKGQDSCIHAFKLCPATIYNFDSSTGLPAPSGPNYGCLGAVLNPLWFSIHITATGSVLVNGAATDGSGEAVDVDFIYWGPFSSLDGICYSQLDSSHILGCDYTGSNLIDINIPAAPTDSYYIGMISNYSDAPANISLGQSGGTATISCVTTCIFNDLSAVPSSCNPADGTYSVSGSISFSNPPTTGTLTLFGSSGGTQIFSAPFISPVDYSFTGLSANGATCIVAAGFSDDVSCGITKSYVSPPACAFEGIAENIANMNLNLSPNPTSGLVDLRFESSAQNISIIISDVSGRTIYKEDLVKFTGVYKKQIDLSSISKGIYFVKVEGERNYVARKLIYN